MAWPDVCRSMLEVFFFNHPLLLRVVILWVFGCLGEEVIIFKRLRGSWEVVWTLVRLMFLFGFHGYESYNYSLGTIFLRSKPPFSLGGSFC